MASNAGCAPSSSVPPAGGCHVKRSPKATSGDELTGEMLVGTQRPGAAIFAAARVGSAAPSSNALTINWDVSAWGRARAGRLEKPLVAFSGMWRMACVPRGGSVVSGREGVMLFVLSSV